MFIASGWTLLLVFALVCFAIRDLGSQVHYFQIAYLLGFAGYAILVRTICRAPGQPRWWTWFLGAAVLRAFLWPTAPGDDVSRYVWEGRIQTEGFNPYVIAPNDPKVVHLRDDDWSRINHPDYSAIYPPLSQLLFRFLAFVYPNVYVFKTVFVILDLAVIWILSRWLQRSGRPPIFAFVYGLCPLVLTAFGIEGHLDSLMILALVGAGWAGSAKLRGWPGVLIGLAVTSKTVAVISLACLVLRRWQEGLIAIIVTALLYVPYLGTGGDLFSSLFKFTNATNFLGLWGTLTEPWMGGNVSRMVALSLLAAAVFVPWWRHRTLTDASRVGYEALILLMPVVHYWYVAWVLALLSFRPRAAWLVLAASMVFYFEAERVERLTGQWALPSWAFYAVYIPFILVWILTLRIANRGTVLRTLFPVCQRERGHSV